VQNKKMILAGDMRRILDIHASPAKIWAHVIRVETIPEKADHGSLSRFLGLPRPVRAISIMPVSAAAAGDLYQRAGLRGKLIMKDIQNNILQVIQTRCEGKL
jgi:hypothetical protein